MKDKVSNTFTGFRKGNTDYVINNDRKMKKILDKNVKIWVIFVDMERLLTT